MTSVTRRVAAGIVGAGVAAGTLVGTSSTAQAWPWSGPSPYCSKSVDTKIVNRLTVDTVISKRGGRVYWVRDYRATFWTERQAFNRPC